LVEFGIVIKEKYTGYSRRFLWIYGEKGVF